MSRAELVSACVAARRLGVHERTVRRWIARGVIAGRELRVYRDGRARWYVLRSALERMLADRA